MVVYCVVIYFAKIFHFFNFIYKKDLFFFEYGIIIISRLSFNVKLEFQIRIILNVIQLLLGRFCMRLRKQELGDRNLVGARVEAARKKRGMKQKELLAQLQVSGVDMNASGLSKLEGQIRYVTDVELVALADILEVSVDYLLGRSN